MTTSKIAEAVHVLRAGGLVAFPTETVYGLGADAHQASAVDHIFHAKERPYDHPLIVHIAHQNQLQEWARDIPQAAITLAKAFWPGPLTLVLKKQPSVLDKVTGGQDTIGLRIPRHPIAQALLQAFGSGIAAPSANKFTHISPTTAQAVKEELGDRVELILEGGDCEVGLESTIIDISGPKPTILRPGMITAAAIASVLDVPILHYRQDMPLLRAPGMHPVHYAPTTKTILLAGEKIATFISSLSAADLPIALLLHSDLVLPKERNIHCILMPKEATAYAHDLYQTLRRLDQAHYKQIIIEGVPYHPDWEAIRDRLSKATGGRR